MLTNNFQGSKPNASHSIDHAIETNLRDLERLALFYHERGDLQRANELYRAARTIREQIEARHEADQLRTMNVPKTAPQQQTA